MARIGAIADDGLPRRVRLSGEGYPYAYARISARKGRLIPRSEYQKLLKMEESGIIRYLEQSSYKESIDSLVGTYSGVDLMERALNLDMARTAEQLRRITPDEVRLLIDAFLRRWDVHNVKTIIRGLAANVPREQVAALLIPAGTLGDERLAELGELSEVPLVLKRARIAGAQDAQKLWIEKRDLVELENVLDKAYFAETLALAERINEEGAPFRRFLREEAEVADLRTLLRLKRLGLAPAAIERHLIGGGESFDAKQWRRLVEADGFAGALTLLRKGAYRDVFARAGDDLVEIELALEQRLVKRSFLSNRQHPLTVMSIMSYLLAKVMEMRNLKAILKAKQLGLDESFIEQKLIV